MALQKGRTGSASINQALDASERAPIHTVANLPPANKNTGKIVYVSNGAAGAPCLAYSNGTNWLRILLGAAVATS